MGNQIEVQFTGGEYAGLNHWQVYLDGSYIDNYKEVRNKLDDWHASSKLSPWLASGCLSPRKVWHDIDSYEQTKVKNKSTYWLKFELLWREYFQLYGYFMPQYFHLDLYSNIQMAQWSDALAYS